MTVPPNRPAVISESKLGQGTSPLRLENPDIILDWYPDMRVAYQYFRNPHLQESAAEIYARLRHHTGGSSEMFCLLVDCSALKSVSIGYRQIAAHFFISERHRVQIWVYGLHTYTRFMTKLFFRATGVTGGAVDNLSAATIAAGIAPWHPQTMHHHTDTLS